MEMIERLLLHWVDGERTRLPIDLADESSSMIAATATNASLSVANATAVRTELTLHSSVFQSLIISALVHTKGGLRPSKAPTVRVKSLRAGGSLKHDRLIDI